jgi:hypothetical protein
MASSDSGGFGSETTARKTRDATKILDHLTGDDTELRETIAEALGLRLEVSFVPATGTDG